MSLTADYALIECIEAVREKDREAAFAAGQKATAGPVLAEAFERAEKAEAERDQWKANHGEVLGMLHMERAARQAPTFTEAQIDDMAFGYCPSGEIGELRAFARALLSPAQQEPAKTPRQSLYEMQHDDGHIAWYFDCEGHYIDVEKDAEGKYSVYFRDRTTDKEAWIDQSETTMQQEPAKAPTYADIDAVAWGIQERKEAASATDAGQAYFEEQPDGTITPVDPDDLNASVSHYDGLPPLPENLDIAESISLRSIDCPEFLETLGAYAQKPDMDTAWAVLQCADRRMHEIMRKRFALAGFGAAQATPSLPSTPDEVIAFIGSNFDSSHTQGDKADWRYQVSVHDLLSAFSEWQDFPAVQAALEGEQDLPPLMKGSMTRQEKLLALADRIDHEKLWRQPAMDRHTLTDDQQARLDAGVMLRRYADILAPGRWLVIPPTGGVQFSAGSLDAAYEMAKRDEARKAAGRAAPPQQVGESGLPV
jgi:hypothetical protein